MLVVLGAHPLRAVADDEIVDKDHHLALDDAQKETLYVLHDGNGHVFVLGGHESPLPDLYYGSVDELHYVPVPSSGGTGSSGRYDWTPWAPRFGRGQVTIDARDSFQSWHVRCGDRTTKLELADDALRAKILRVIGIIADMQDDLVMLRMGMFENMRIGFRHGVYPAVF